MSKKFEEEEEEEEEDEVELQRRASEEKILYALVARENVVLVEYSVREGNHVLLAQQILAKPKGDQDHKRTFPDKSGKYNFHYMQRDGLIFMCFALAEKLTAVCYNFLEECRVQFVGTYDVDQWKTAIAYSTKFLDFRDVLKREMARYSKMEHASQLVADNYEKIEKVKVTMKENIDKLWERDSQIDTLMAETEVLNTESTKLNVNAKKVEAAMLAKNRKIWCIVIIVVLVLVWLIASLICGFTFQKCFGKGGKCFHEDTKIEYRTPENVVQLLSLKELFEKENSELCRVPHQVWERGLRLRCLGSDSLSRTLRVTDKHLVFTSAGLVEAGSVVEGAILFLDLNETESCRVTVVQREEQQQRYLGLNCAHSEVIADGVKTSIWGSYHRLPSLFMRVLSPLLGVSRTSRLGEAILHGVNVGNVLGL